MSLDRMNRIIQNPVHFVNTVPQSCPFLVRSHSTFVLRHFSHPCHPQPARRRSPKAGSSGYPSSVAVLRRVDLLLKNGTGDNPTEKQICPRMTRISVNDFLFLDFFRVYSRALLLIRPAAAASVSSVLSVVQKIFCRILFALIRACPP